MDYCEMAEIERQKEAAKWMAHHINDATPYRSSDTPMGHRRRSSAPSRGELAFFTVAIVALLALAFVISN